MRHTTRPERVLLASLAFCFAAPIAGGQQAKPPAGQGAGELKLYDFATQIGTVTQCSQIGATSKDSGKSSQPRDAGGFSTRLDSCKATCGYQNASMSAKSALTGYSASGVMLWTWSM